MVTVVAVVSAAVLAAVLVVAPKIDALRGVPRSRWLSFAGGVAVTYVFLKLLPELTKAQREIMHHHPSAAWLREHMLFVVALVGATLLFGIERAAKRTKEQRKSRGEEPRSAAWVFWLHTAVMSVYVAFIAYLLFREGKQRPLTVGVLGGVMALHFTGIAVALADDYRSLQSRWGRWLLAASVLAGAAVGYARKVPDIVYHVVLAVLAGAVIFSVIKEEIPPEQQSRFWALAVGVAVAGALLWAAR